MAKAGFKVSQSVGEVREIRAEILQRLFALQDLPYQAFQSKLIPSISPESMIGVRTPALRQLAKELHHREDVGEFLADLPHRYFDENQLHAFLISMGKDFNETVSAVDLFLPYVDNWATCDQLSPRVFRTHRDMLLPHINGWMSAKHPYTVRFGIGMLMQHFLDEQFDPVYLEWVAALQSDEYYIKMMIAWYFATALAKQYDAAMPYITGHRLDPWTHNKTIQKAIESFRVPEERKMILRSQKNKN